MLGDVSSDLSSFSHLPTILQNIPVRPCFALMVAFSEPLAMVGAIFNNIHSQSSSLSQLLGSKDFVAVVSSYIFTMQMVIDKPSAKALKHLYLTFPTLFTFLCFQA